MEERKSVEQDRKCTYNPILRRVCITIFAVQRKLLHIMCTLNYPELKACGLYYCQMCPFRHDLYSLRSIVRVVKSRRMRWAGHVARTGEDRGVHRVLVGKPEGRRPLGRPRRRWQDNIKMDLQEVGGGREDWMELVQDRDRWRALVGTVRDIRVP